MISYLGLFLVVLAITYIAEYCYRIKVHTISKLLIFVSILILSIFAGVRSTSVGTDLNVYFIRHFELAGKYNLLALLENQKNEYFYWVLMWSIRNLTDDIHVAMFIHQFIISVIVYSVAYKQFVNKKGKLTFYILVYLFIWYGTTLNIIRQSLGIFIVFPAFDYLLNKEWKKYFILVFIGSMFHTSLIIYFLCPLFLILNNKKNKYIYITFGTLALLVAIKFLQPIVQFLSLNIMGFEKYTNYFNEKHGNFNPYYFLIKCIIFLFSLLFLYFIRKNKQKELDILLLYMIADLIGYMLSIVIRYGYRISYPFLVYQILFFPRIDMELQYKKNKLCFRVGTVILFCLYWYYRYIKIGYDGIIPYKFM